MRRAHSAGQSRRESFDPSLIFALANGRHGTVRQSDGTREFSALAVSTCAHSCST